MHTEDGDAALVQAAQAGSKEAFGVLFARHRGLLLGVCRRMLGDTGLLEDVAQEVALQAMLHLEHLRTPERFGPWLAGIGLNVCHRLRRARARDAWSWEALHGGRLAEEPLDKQAGPEELAEAADLARSVRYAVADLPVGQRAAMALVYLSGLTQAEAAAMLGIEVGAVKARLHKARATLRRRLWAHWKEVPMATEVQTEAVEMRVADVRRRPAEGDRPARYIIVLEEVTGTRNLSIWVGEFEGQSIAMLLEDVQVPRPLTFTFVASLLQAGGARLQEVRVHRLEEKTYYAVAVVEGAAGTRTVDARPSDAFALALVTGAPIYVAPAVLETSDAAEPTRPVSREEMVRTSIGSAEIVTDIIDKWPVEPKPTRRTG